MLFNDQQSLNAKEPISFIVGGITICLSEVQLLNAESEIHLQFERIET